MVIGRDGKRRPAQYIGLDGITGLSLLRISDKSLPTFTSTGATTVTIKQRVRLFAPEPVDERASTNSSVSVRLGETAGTIVSLKHGLDGTISRIKMNSLKLSAVNIGGIAVNDAGQTIGIVASIEKNEALILPPTVIRGAAERVLARKEEVPRPWLGVSGEPAWLHTTGGDR
jgi:S1-C subfamily serine protease